MALTTQETTELAKIVAGVRLLASSLNKVSAAILADTVGFSRDKRTDYTNAIGNLLDGALHYEQALAEILYVYIKAAESRANFPYPTNLANAKNFFVGGGNGQAEARIRLQKYPELAGALSDSDKASAIFASFDWTLPFASPLPPDYPKIVGPHGTYDPAQGLMVQVRKYLGEASFIDIYAQAINWPASSNFAYASLIGSAADLIDRQIRVLGLLGWVEAPDDTIRIDNAKAAGTNLRPRSFFRALLAHEIAMSGGSLFQDFSQRISVQGINISLRNHVNFGGIVFGQTVRANPDMTNFLLGQLADGGGFFGDMTIAWTSLDEWSLANNNFFFEIPKPPVPLVDCPDVGTATVPVGYFNAEVAKLDEIAADAVAVKSDLRAKEGKAI